MLTSMSTQREVSEAASAMGRLGGYARAARLTPDELSRIGRLGAAAHWKDHTPKHPRKARRPAGRAASGGSKSDQST